jgi:DNA-binding IclR family transcriptional regulator
MTRAANEGSIKSARRVIEILEYFDIGRQETNVSEIARELGYPQSSTTMLMRSLVDLGYLTFDSQKRTFRLSPVVPLLGAWVQPEIFHSGRLFALMNDLHDRTGELVAIATRVGRMVRLLHAIYAPGSVPRDFTKGRRRQMLHSPFGKVILASYPEKEIRTFIRRANSECAAADRVSPNAMVEELRRIDESGYAMASRDKGGQRGQLAILLPIETGARPFDSVSGLALGVDTPEETMWAHHKEWLKLMRDLVRKHFGKSVSDLIKSP